MTITRLIRDKLADTPKEGIEVEFLEPGGAAHRIALVAKMHEEVCEIEKAPTDVQEYADLVEALVALATFNGISPSMIDEARYAKLRERGGFYVGAVMVRR